MNGPGERRQGHFTYENGLLLLLGFAFGVAFFDRNAGTILIPFIEKDLHLTNTQVGLIGSGLAVTWAIGAYVIGRWSDAVGVRKPFLLGCLLIFSACSVVSGLAQSYPLFLASRMVMGAVEGPFLPICLAIMAVESSPGRLGLNQGIMQNVCSAVVGQALAPIVLVPLAEHFGWRAAFYLAGLPGLACALAVLVWVREPARLLLPALAASGSGQKLGLLQMLRIRNILLCCLIAMFLVGWLITGVTFLPRYLVDVRGLSPRAMSYIMGGVGLFSAIGGVIGIAVSDRVGRKPVLAAFALFSVVTPLAVLFFQGPSLVLGILTVIGWTAPGAFPLFMGIIPNETISSRYAATAMGLAVGAGELIGGFGIVTASGVIADATSAAAPLVIMTACAIIGALLTLLLIETAPAKLAAAAAVRQAAAA